VLMEIMASNMDPTTRNLQPSHPIDAIQGPKSGGRKREVDFAVLTRAAPPQTPSLLHCIEAKWAGSSHCKPVNVLTDLTRLALISQEHPEATCLFLLAGGKDSVAKLLEKQLSGLSRESNQSPLPSAYTGGIHRFNFKNAAGGIDRALNQKRLEFLSEEFERVPIQLRTMMYKPGHDTPPNWRVHVWRVTAKAEPQHS